MTRTPDARAGELLEDEGILLGTTLGAAQPGEIRYNGTSFSLQDSLGEFNPRSGFAVDLNSGEYITPFSTSSGTYQQVWRFSTPSLPVGSYFIAAIAMLDTSNAGNVTDVRIQLDDVTTIGAWIAPVGYVGGNTPLIGLQSITLTAGVHTFDFDIRKVSGNGSVIMKSCYITLWKVA